MRRPGNIVVLVVLSFLLISGLPGCKSDRATPLDHEGSPTGGTAAQTGTELAATSPTTAAWPTREPTPTTLPTLTATPVPPAPTGKPTAQPTATAPAPTATDAPPLSPAPLPTLPPRLEPRLIIPALSIDAVVVPVGLDANRAMAAPEGWFEIGWFRYGPRPGFPGSAALAGHLDTNTGAPATFWDLGKLAPGQEVIYQAEDGSQVTFVADEIATYAWDEVPLDRVFARSGEPRLALITCGGQWSREHRNYSHRTIVYAGLP